MLIAEPLTERVIGWLSRYIAIRAPACWNPFTRNAFVASCDKLISVAHGKSQFL